MNPTPILRLKPMDVALFRDARPFSANDSTGARLQSDLPPQLGLLGAMRMLLLREQRLSFQQFHGGAGGEAVGRTPGQPGTLRLGPVTLLGMVDGERKGLYGIPSDLVKVRRRQDGVDRWAYQVPGEGGGRTSLPGGLKLLQPAWFEGGRLRFATEGDALQVSEGEAYTLPFDSLASYLLGKQVRTGPRIGHYLDKERRIGIERNAATFTVVPERLYTAEFLRMTEQAWYALPVLEAGENLARQVCVVPIGGESRPFEVVRDSDIHLIPAEAEQQVKAALLKSGGADTSVCFRLILLSPSPPGEGIQGWLPDLPRIEGVELTVYAAAVSRPRWLSGWMTGETDANGTKTKGGHPRKARPYIPEGSVFYVKAVGEHGAEGLVDSILSKFWYKSSLCTGGENEFDRCAGNGVTVVGVVPNANE